MIISSHKKIWMQSLSWKLKPVALIWRPRDRVFSNSSDRLILYTFIDLLFVITIWRSFNDTPAMAAISLCITDARDEFSMCTCVAVFWIAQMSRVCTDNSGCSCNETGKRCVLTSIRDGRSIFDYVILTNLQNIHIRNAIDQNARFGVLADAPATMFDSPAHIWFIIQLPAMIVAVRYWCGSPSCSLPRIHVSLIRSGAERMTLQAICDAGEHFHSGWSNRCRRRYYAVAVNQWRMLNFWYLTP